MPDEAVRAGTFAASRVDIEDGMTPDEIATLDGVAAAREEIRRRDADTVDEQIRITRIPSPTGGERSRAAYVAQRFASMGLVGICADEAGNVFGRLPSGGSGAATHPRGEPPVLVTAHLDTIFPADAVIDVSTVDGRISAPGITDNSRGLAALLRLAESIVAAGIVTRVPLVFVATVGEEGLGDLRGVKQLFAPRSPHLEAAAFVSLDGAGLSRIVHRAIGSRRFRISVIGPGGHSWGDRGLANAAHALAAGIGAVARLVRPGSDGVAVNVGRIGGGTSVNAIPEEAWCEVDLRADREEALAALVAAAKTAFAEAVDGEAARAAIRTPLECRFQEVGSRPCGETAEKSPLVQAAIAATRLVGDTPELAASSTDANVPMSLGIPSITIGAGGRGGGVHTLAEWFENQDGALGIERALLAILAVAGVRASGHDAADDASMTE